MPPSLATNFLSLSEKDPSVGHSQLVLQYWTQVTLHGIALVTYYILTDPVVLNVQGTFGKAWRHF